MNVKEYIESGSLELYVAGALNEKERREAEEMIKTYPEVRAELEAIESAFESYAFTHAVDAPEAVITNVLRVIADENSSKKENPTETGGKTIHMKTGAQKPGSILRYLAYAASLLLFVSIMVNIYYYNSYKRVEGELASLQDANTYLTDQYDVIRTDYSKLQTDLSIIHDPNTIAITMKGQPISPNSTTLVYWDKTSGNVYLSANNLPIPESGKQYQLWALKDGKPIDAGVFDMNGDLQQMKNIPAADAFAVTLEPAGGSVGPTMEQLYVVGEV